MFIAALHVYLSLWAQRERGLLQLSSGLSNLR